VRARERELGLPEEFEWVQQVTPGMRNAALAAGLRVDDRPLLALPAETAPESRPPPAGIELRLATPDDDVATFQSVAAVGFAYPGTAVGEAGAEELRRRAAERPPELVEFERERLRAGSLVLAVALQDGLPVASGAHLPVGEVTEIAGVATLPAFRRQGLGAAVTALLAADARARGLATIFLSAGDDYIARLYASLGFARIGTACAAQPA
jgi:ribosomal protein S18 acetylase RimI-like enzyme